MLHNTKNKKNKRGQFFIFTAILICLLLFYLYSMRSSTVFVKSSDFERLHKNFIKEASIVITNSLYNEGNLTLDFQNFTDSFISFAKKQANMTIFYALIHNDIYFKNYFPTSVIVTTFYYNRTDGIFTVLDNFTYPRNISAFSIVINNKTYKFTVTNNPIELKVLLYSSRAGKKQVYTYDR